MGRSDSSTLQKDCMTRENKLGFINQTNG